MVVEESALANKSGVLRSASHRLLALRNIPRSQSKNVMQLELKGLTAAPRSLYRASAELFRYELERFTPSVLQRRWAT